MKIMLIIIKHKSAFKYYYRIIITFALSKASSKALDDSAFIFLAERVKITPLKNLQ